MIFILLIMNYYY